MWTIPKRVRDRVGVGATLVVARPRGRPSSWSPVLVVARPRGRPSSWSPVLVVARPRGRPPSFEFSCAPFVVQKKPFVVQKKPFVVQKGFVA
jgi:hypothetical protein